MAILLALGAAITYGASDFTGGLLSKTVRVFVVLLVSQIIGSVLLVAALPFIDGVYSSTAITWGLAAGVAATVGASLLYRGLAIGRMSVVAPVTGVLAAVVPVAYGLATGERPGVLALAGSALAIAAVVIVTRAPGAGNEGGGQRGIVEAIGAGAGFGFFFILLERSPEDSGLWPLVGTRISMLVLTVAVLAVTRTRIEIPRAVMPTLLLLAVLNTSSDLLFLLATREGLLSVVAVLASLYPASTIVLARVVLHERMAGLQPVGLGVAGVSVVLIALGS